jgi:hypothetical protein
MNAASVPVVSEAPHGTPARWHSGCRCALCRAAHSHTKRAWRHARARKRLPLEIRQQLLDAIYAGQPFRTVLRDLELSPNQVWGLTRTDDAWSIQLEAALTTTRRDDLDHGTNAAYVAGCVCSRPPSISGTGWAGTVARLSTHHDGLLDRSGEHCRVMLEIR